VSTAELKIAGRSARHAESEGWLYRAVLSTPFLGLALLAVSWPVNQIAPGLGPDFSWMAGLYMAHAEGLHFGKDLFFTYGPLGFLEVPVLYEPGLWMVAFCYQLLVHAALAISLLWVARRALPLPVALTACYVALVAAPLGAAAVVLAFIWSFVATQERCPWSLRRNALRCVALLAAVELLGKQNYGLTAFILVVLAAATAAERRRLVPEVLAISGLGYLLLWAASGQSVSLLPEFLSRQAVIVSGYSSAMPADILAHSWEIPAAVGGIALLLAAAAWGSWGSGRVQRAGALLVCALFCFASFKQGFVRHSSGNTPEFFAVLACAGIVVASRLPRRGREVGTVALLAPLFAVLLVVTPGISISRTLDPVPHVDILAYDIGALTSPDRRRAIVAESRGWMKEVYGLDRGFLRAIGGRPVQVEPWEASAAWAYELNWQPLPTLQGYAAYTPSLDRLDADAFESVAGPQLVLRHRNLEPGEVGVDTVDGRYPGWSSPAAMRALLCNYRPVRTTGEWQLLERAPRRCGAQRSMGRVAARTGEAIPLPAARPDEMVFARVAGLEVAGVESLRTLAFRARERTASFDGGRSWRLVPATAGDGLIMSVPASRDFPPPFRLAPGARTVQFAVDGGSERPLTVEFFAQRVGLGRR
jgi:hypothetical protein